MRATRVILMVAGLGALAGCDSFSFGEDGFEDRLEESQDRVDEIQEAGFTDPSTLPTTGTAEYNGTAILEVEDADPYRLAGELEMEVGFADEGEVSGTIGNFVDEDDEEVDGEITMTGGTIDRDATGTLNLDPTFTLDLGGSIESPDGTTYSVDEGIALGDFYGDGEFVFGGLAGEMCSDDECLELGGTFDGER